MKKALARRLKCKPGEAKVVSMSAQLQRVAVSQQTCQFFPSTQHPAPSTQHPAPSTQHPILRLTVEVGNW